MKIAGLESCFSTHAEDTFVTAVFNGSASLRDAAGQLIEDVTKSVRTKKEIDDAYIENLYSDVTSLCHLDQISAGGSQREKGSGPPAENFRGPSWRPLE